MKNFPFQRLKQTRSAPDRSKCASVSRDSSGLIESVSFTENPQYVLGRPYLDGIRFVFYSSSENLTNALASGVVEARRFPSAKTLTAPYVRVFGVFWNPSENQVFARAEVRKALSLAINRQTIVDTVFDGYGTAIMGPCHRANSVEQVLVPQSIIRQKLPREYSKRPIDIR